MSYRHHPNLIHAYRFHANRNWEQMFVMGFGYTPARPIDAPTFLRRLRLAWCVLIGRYDAIVWPGQE
jgi:hypothetical protein